MSVITAILGAVTAPFFRTVENIVHDVAQQKMSETEARKAIELARLDLSAKLGQEITAQYESFQSTLRTSDLLQRLTAAVCITQLMVLVFYQVGVPSILFVTGWRFPTPDIQVEWAYATVTATLGIYGIIRRV